VKSDSKPALLIVDDDPLITDTLHFVLSNDFDVFVAESRQQVKSLLTQLDTPPPLALVDLGLPPAQHKPDEGFALISDLLNYSKKTRILVLSGQNDDANARHARALGAIDFIAKPADPEKIKQACFPPCASIMNNPPPRRRPPRSSQAVSSVQASRWIGCATRSSCMPTPRFRS
jgi:ActR/RegA family two-component response regulator